MLFGSPSMISKSYQGSSKWLSPLCFVSPTTSLDSAIFGFSEGLLVCLSLAFSQVSAILTISAHSPSSSAASSEVPGSLLLQSPLASSLATPSLAWSAFKDSIGVVPSNSSQSLQTQASFLLPGLIAVVWCWQSPMGSSHSLSTYIYWFDNRYLFDFIPTFFWWGLKQNLCEWTMWVDKHLEFLLYGLGLFHRLLCLEMKVGGLLLHLNSLTGNGFPRLF